MGTMEQSFDLSGGGRSRRRRLANRLAEVVATLAALSAVAVLAIVVLSIAKRGIGEISWSFLTEPPEKAGRAGGIGPILVSTALILAVCLASSLPVM